MMTVTVTTQPTISFGQPRLLFSGRYSMNAPARGYDVTADGTRFLLLQERPRTPNVITRDDGGAKLVRGAQVVETIRARRRSFSHLVRVEQVREIDHSLHAPQAEREACGHHRMN